MIAYAAVLAVKAELTFVSFGAGAAIVADSVFVVPIAAVNAFRFHRIAGSDAGAAVGAVGAEITGVIWGAGAAIFAFVVVGTVAAVLAERFHLPLFKAVLSAEPGQ